MLICIVSSIIISTCYYSMLLCTVNSLLVLRTVRFMVPGGGCALVKPVASFSSLDLEPRFAVKVGFLCICTGAIARSRSHEWWVFSIGCAPQHLVLGLDVPLTFLHTDRFSSCFSVTKQQAWLLL